jgi:SNF2 family DNA or RNA helicase
MFPKVPVIAGGTPMTKTTEYIRAWNNKELPLLLCHPASLSHAVNMQYGSYIVLWFAIPWSSEQYLQLNKRVHRQGQEHPVVIHHFCMMNTIDVAIMNGLKSKINNQQHFLDYIKAYRESMYE